MGTSAHERSPGNTRPDREGSGRDNTGLVEGDKLYGFTCLWPHCSASREFGAAQINRDVQAAKHHRRFPHHRIALYEKRISHVFTENTIPLNVGDKPPF